MNTYTFWVELTLRVSVQADNEKEAHDKLGVMSTDKMIDECEQFDMETTLIKEN